MNRLVVHVSPFARDQIREQFLYIARRNPGNALAWNDRLNQTIDALGEIQGYAKDEEASDRVGYTVHKVVFEGTYLIHFRVDLPAIAVEIMNFRHGGRLPRRGEP